MTLLYRGHLPREVGMELREQFGERRLIDELEFECGAEGWQFHAPFVLGDDGKRSVSKE